MYVLTRRLTTLFLCLLLLVPVHLGSMASSAAADSTFYITGRGWGHGIGLSQYGARELGKRVNPSTGRLYTGPEIVRYYFGNTSRTTVDSVTGKWVKVRLDRDATSSNAGYTATAWTLRGGHEGSRLLIKASNLPTAGVTTASDSWHKFVPVEGGTAVSNLDSTRWKPNGVSVLTGTVTVEEVGNFSPKLVQVFQGTGIYDQAYARYRGQLKISSNDTRLKLVNYLSMEHYLYGVVPREMPASWADESPAGMQAQAITARSYAYVSSGELFTTTMSQAYQGHSAGLDRNNTDAWEDSRSNAAIDATRGKVARYRNSDGTYQIIRTYFSSTSGGHTADIENVWTSATPQPFYKGIVDPDVSSPYYADWGDPIALTGTQLASKLRAGSYTKGNVEPSPAIVSSTAISRASNGSGFAVRVTVTWSNGNKRSYTGDAIRNALGLRSTKFSIGRGYVPKPPDASGIPPAPPMTIYQQSDGRFFKVGPWSTSTGSSYSGGSRVYTTKGEAWFIAEFTGTSVRWVGTTGPTYGKAVVYLDGKAVKTVDLYRSTSKPRQVIYQDFNLAPGEHKLEIRALGTKRSASSGTRVCVDYITVDASGSLSQATTLVRRLDQKHVSLRWTGLWNESPDYTGTYDDVYGGTHRFSNARGSRMYLEFWGTGFDWSGCVSSKNGIAKVTIDGVSRTVDTYSATAARGKLLLAARDLGWGKHTVVIEVTGTKRAEADGVTISVDSLDLYGGLPRAASIPHTLVDQNSKAVAYTGSWTTRTLKGTYGGTHAASPNKGAEFVLGFDGPAVDWRGTMGPTSGRANVYVDGVYEATVNLYASSTATRRLIYRASGLSTGRHTLKVRVLGAHSSASKGNWVSIDYANVTGSPVMP